MNGGDAPSQGLDCGSIDDKTAPVKSSRLVGLILSLPLFPFQFSFS